jgi:pimeloyl-ACP methyl ester carboxylesterase
MDIILLPGLWLRSTAWDAVADELRGLGHHPIAVALPGVDDGDASATLDDQIAAVLAAVDDADRPFVVGHSAASTLAWIAADRRADAIVGVAMIGGFPTADGGAYADFFDAVDGVMPFPGWEPFDGPDSADLDEAARERFVTEAVAVPLGVSKAVVHIGDERRRRVPVTLVCPEFGPDDARAWIAGGDLPELAAAEHVSFVDIDSGHWPMLTRPVELAALLAGAAASVALP